MKKMIALVLTLLFLIPSFALADEVPTLTLWGPGANPQYDWDDTVLVKKLEEKFGINLECTSVGWDEYKTKLTLMLAEDNLPDIILGAFGLADAIQYGDQGYLLKLNDYIDTYAPNLATTLEAYPMLKNYMGSSEGNYYMIPLLKTSNLERYPKVWINTEWLKNVNMEAPTTIDELYEVLKAFKEQDANGNGDPNDEIPFSASMTWHSGGMTTMLMGAFGMKVSNSMVTGYQLQADEDGEVYITATTEEYKAFVAFMNKLYTEGLLDNESFIQTGDEFCAKVAENRVGFFGGESPSLTVLAENVFNEKFAYVGSLTSELNPVNQVIMTPAYTQSNRMSISANTPYPEIAVQILDYFYSDEGIMAGLFGFEGETYEIINKDVEGLKVPKIVYLAPTDWTDDPEKWLFTHGVIQNHFNFIKGPTLVEAFISSLSAEDANKVITIDGKYALMVRDSVSQGVPAVEMMPNLVYTGDEAAARSTLFTDIDTYIITMRDQFITGVLPVEENWQTFQNTLITMGLEDILEIEQAAYDRMK